MKKLVFVLAACAVFAACGQSSKGSANAEGTDSTAVATSDSVVYEGVVPAADCPGIRYELVMANDTTNGFTLTTTMLEAENGQDVTTKFDGKAEIIEQKTADGERKFYKLASDKEAVYLLVVNDSTLRLVNDRLEEAASNLNYDLKLKK